VLRVRERVAAGGYVQHGGRIGCRVGEQFSWGICSMCDEVSREGKCVVAATPHRREHAVAKREGETPVVGVESNDEPVQRNEGQLADSVETTASRADEIGKETAVEGVMGACYAVLQRARRACSVAVAGQSQTV